MSSRRNLSGSRPGLNAFENIEVTSVADKAATKANILKTLDTLSSKVQPEDALVIFFAGHGLAQKKRFYLIPHDLGYRGERAGAGPAAIQRIQANSISDIELESAVEDIDAGQFLLVIDACNSGQALETEEKRRGPMNSQGLAQLAYEKGMFILTAAQGFQAAKEDARLGHGYLTFALVEDGLKAGKADRPPKDGQIFMREWLDYATDRVPQIDKEEVEKEGIQGRKLEREKSDAAGKTDSQGLQHPKVFYPRETDIRPFLVAKLP